MPLFQTKPLWSLSNRPTAESPGWVGPSGSIDEECPGDILGRLTSGDGVGLVLGPYYLLEQLGAGAMAQVYKAEHLLMKRLVALKVLRPPVGEKPTPSAALPPGVRLDPPVTHPFYREARAAALLNHPNVVLLYDAVELGGLHLLVLEYVDGPDLGRLVQSRGALPVALACECVRQAALGLHYAHDRGLVHADVKPSNLLISGPEEAPRVKVLDLGLARAHGANLPQIGPVSAPSDLAGTPDFMAPEVARGDTRGEPSSDQYSLGCTFYYLLAGQPPFPGGTWLEKLMRHQLERPAPVRQVRPEVPAEVAAVVERLMAPEPAKRYANLAQAAVELHEWLFEQRQRTADSEVARVTPLVGECATLPEVEEPPATPVDAPAAPDALPASPRRAFRKARQRRRAFGWSLAAGALVGLLAAWGLGQWVKQREASVETPPPAIAETASPRAAPAPFILERDGSRFPTLGHAVAATRDGDSVMIEGAGPYPTGPLELHGKALTLRAAPGARPCLELSYTLNGHFWQPLVESDAALTLEGLELRRAGGAVPAAAGTSPLVIGSGPSLHLRDCTLAVPGGSMPVLCRGCRDVELRGCTLRAEALAVCVELPEQGPFQMKLVANEVRVASGGGAAVALSVHGGRTEETRLLLEENHVEAGRVLALNRWTGRLDVSARGNAFRWREALVSFTGCGADLDCRRALAWQGERNHFDGGTFWVRVEGNPAGGAEQASLFAETPTDRPAQ